MRHDSEVIATLINENKILVDSNIFKYMVIGSKSST